MKITRTVELKEKGKLLVVDSPASLNEAAAELMLEAADSAIAKRGRFTVALSGGSTPKALYELLTTDRWRDRFDWSKVHVFWGDERWVPSTDKQSNYRMSDEALLSKVPIPQQNVHRINTDSGTPEEAAAKYESDLRSFFGARPQIDFDLLGLGTNGHTASLFPHRPTLGVTDKLVVADYIDEVKMNRITFTLPLILDSHTNLFLVSGAEKAGVLNEVLCGSADSQRLPAQLVRVKEGALLWLADEAAAANVQPFT